ncbi:hypothetical protein C8034_v008061 [Colletotrichum sidae]|uniref:Uncharacterized protein n=1 Tax=Colletotrichum sidae TaxID=1347389 RepID=A0A4V3I1Q2_9PEZI|nr:hypothetical protein C8034_v008061 [Colletotrichum sidae]
MGQALSQQVTKANTETIVRCDLEVTLQNDSTEVGKFWVASLCINTHDVGKLMKKGFNFSKAHVVRGKGGVLLNTCPFRYSSHQGKSLKHTRHHILKCPEEKWEAHLYVMAEDISALGQFRMHDMRMDRITRTWAWGSNEMKIYNYDAKNPGHNYNTLLEDVALPGDWPWPKKEDISAEWKLESIDEKTA